MKARGVTHIHSTFSSDGALSLPELKALFKERGLSFACMTEHTDEMTAQQADAFVRECERSSDREFVFVPGFEVPYRHAHLLMIGAHAFVSSVADERSLRTWKERTELCVLAHPHRNGFVVDTAMQEVIDGIEVWNAQYDGKHLPRFAALRLLKDLQTKNPELLAVCGLDLHRREHMGSPEISLAVDELSAEAVVAALRKGEYFIGQNGTVIVSSAGNMEKVSRGMRLIGAATIVFIRASRFAGKELARFGLSLPRSLKRAIRSKV